MLLDVGGVFLLSLYIICASLFGISLLSNKEKSKKAIKTACNMLFKALPSFLSIILIMVIFLYFVPPERIVHLLSNRSEALNIFIASIVGSVVIIPGFIAFPVAGILKDIGVSYGVLAGFTTSFMMVGILTFPLEKKYFGVKFVLYRNLASYFIAIITSLAIGIILKGGA